MRVLPALLALVVAAPASAQVAWGASGPLVVRAARVAVATTASGATEVYAQVQLAAPPADRWALVWPVEATATSASAGDVRLLAGLADVAAPAVVGCPDKVGCVDVKPAAPIVEDAGEDAWVTAAAAGGAVLAATPQLAAAALEAAGLPVGGVEEALAAWAPGRAFIVLVAADSSTADASPIAHAVLPATGRVSLPLALLARSPDDAASVDLFVTAVADHRAAPAVATLVNVPRDQVEIHGPVTTYGALAEAALSVGAAAFTAESAALVGADDLANLDLGPDASRFFTSTRFVTRLRGSARNKAPDDALVLSDGKDQLVSRRIETCHGGDGCATGGGPQLVGLLAVLALSLRARTRRARLC